MLIALDAKTAILTCMLFSVDVEQVPRETEDEDSSSALLIVLFNA